MNPLIALSGGLQVVSGLFQTAAKVNELKSRADASEYEAKIAGYNANLAIQKGQYDAERIRAQGAQAIGSIRANYGASGITGDGSASDIIQASASAVERDAIMTKYKAELQAWQFGEQGRLGRFAASNYRKQSDYALIGGTLSTLTGAAKPDGYFAGG